MGKEGMKGYIFEKEIRIFGMRRSGINAVRNFIVNSFPRGFVVLLLNTDLSFIRSGPFPVMGRRWYKKRYKHFVNTVEHLPITDIGVCLKPNYCYEKERTRWARYYGAYKLSRDKYNLVVIRSPHNNLASALKFPKNKMKYIYYGNNRYLEFTRLWIQYAEEVLCITNHIPNKIVVLFDKLVSDSYYRKSISDALGIPCVYSAINKAHDIGSSFDWNDYAGMAQKMKVLDRWEYLIDPGEEVWWTLDDCKAKLSHLKVVEYTRELFDIDLGKIF